MKNLSEQIKKFRKSKKITQEELADMVGVSVITVKRWEKDRMPRANEMLKLAEALGTTVGALMGETESAPPQKSENLPIGNAPETVNNQNENLGLGYWGSVADNARKVAQRGDSQEKAVAQMMVRIASEALNGVEEFSDAVAKISQHADNIHGNVNQSVGK